MAVLAAALGGLVATRSETQYRARARLLLSPSPSMTDNRQRLDALAVLRSSLVSTLAGVAQSAEVAQEAGARAGLDRRLTEKLEVTARVVPDSLVVRVQVEGDNGRVVGTLAANVVDASVRRFEDLYQIASVEVLDQPDAAEPVTLPASRAAAIAGTVGLGLGFLIAVGRQALTRRR